MKKIFSLVAAVVLCFAANASDYYMTGEAVGWNPTAAQFVEQEGVLTLEVADFYGDFKITEGAWHPQYGAAVGVTTDSIRLNEPYVLTKCDDSEGEKDIEIVHTALPADYRYKDAKFTLTVGEGGVLTLTLVAGTPYDHSVVPATYQLVGAYNNWSTTDAIQFEEVEGVLTATVPDLNGTFKIIQDRAWTNQWATNRETGAGLEVGVAYTLGAKGIDEPQNLGLSNPFYGYKNAVFTLQVGEQMILTLVSGERYFCQNNWYILGNKLGWNCDETTQLTLVEGKENTYEFLAAEFGGDFKVVYGNWAIEFGANVVGDTLEINKEYVMTHPCAGNLNPLSEEVYNNVNITIVADYEKAEVKLIVRPTTGTCGKNLTWTIDKQGTLTISGTGAMVDYKYQETPWYAYKEDIKSVVIDSGVTVIGVYAFHNCSSLTSVTIPNTVTSIGEAAFSCCSGLKSVTIPYGVTNMGNHVFNRCSSLTSITIPDGVTSIGSGAFYFCSGLTSVTIPNSVTNIGSSAFSYCSGLTSVTIPNSVTSIGSSAFSYCSGLTSVTIPNSVKIIDSSAFEYCSGLTSVTLPNTVTAIGDYAFQDCISLPKVTIPNSVISIGSSAFEFCIGLTSVTIPNSVTTIGSGAFSGCRSLTSITIPNGVTTIEYNTFKGCRGLTSVTLPNTITAIGNYAFQDCSSLPKVTVPYSVTSIGVGAFSNCIGLKYVTLSDDNVATIGDYAFKGCYALISVVIPASVTSIGEETFYQCTHLKSVTIPKSVTSIEERAFRTCPFLKTIICDAVNPPSLDTLVFDNSSSSLSLYVPKESVSSYAAADTWKEFNIIGRDVDEPITCAELSGICGADGDSTNVRWEISCDSVLTISGTGTMAGWTAEEWFPRAYAGGMQTACPAPFFDYYDKISSIRIKEGVTHIGGVSLCGYANTVVIPSTVKSIGDGAFMYCSIIDSIFIPASVERIGKAAFMNWINMGVGVYIRSVCFESPVPPVFDNDPLVTGYSSFDKNYPAFYGSSCLIYVPCGSKQAYMDALQGVSEDRIIEKVNNNINYSIIAKSANQGSITIESEEQFCDTMVVTFRADAAEGYQFKQWSDGNTDNPRTLTITQDITLTAEFEPIIVPGSSGENAIAFDFEVGHSQVKNNITWYLIDLSVLQDGILDIRLHVNNVETRGGFLHVQYFVQLPLPSQDDNSTLWNDTVSLSANSTWSRWLDSRYLKGLRALFLKVETNFDAKLYIDLAPALYEVSLSTHQTYGTVEGSGMYGYGDTALISATPAEGYQFKQWSDGNTDNPRSLIVTQDITLTAEFEPIIVPGSSGENAIAFDFEAGHSQVKNNITWYLIDLSALQDGTLDIRLHVNNVETRGGFLHVQYFVQLPLPSQDDNSTLWNDTVSLSAHSTWSRRLDSRYLKELGLGALILKVETDFDAKLYIDFAPALYEVSLSTHQTYGTVEGSGMYGYGETAIISATPAEGYQFKQWSDGNTDNPRTLTITQDITLTAEFERKKCIVIMFGIGCSDTLYIDYGEQLTTQMVEEVQRKFENHVIEVIEDCRNGKVYGWSNCDGNCDGIPYLRFPVTITSDTVMFSQFGPTEYLLTMAANDNLMGEVCVKEYMSHLPTGYIHDVASENDCVPLNSFHCGDTIVFDATPYDGYRFVSWSDGDTYNPRMMSMDGGDYELTAIFEPVEMSAELEMIYVGSTPIENFAPSTYNYTFHYPATTADSDLPTVADVSWTTADTYQTVTALQAGNSVVLSVTSGRGLTKAYVLTFIIDRYEQFVVTTLSNNSEWGIVIGGNTYNANAQVSIGAFAKEGYQFYNWNNEITDNPYTFSLTKDTTFVALFLPNSQEEMISYFGSNTILFEWERRPYGQGYWIYVYLDSDHKHWLCKMKFDKQGNCLNFVWGPARNKAYQARVSEESEANKMILRSRKATAEADDMLTYELEGLASDTEHYFVLETFDENEEVVEAKAGNIRTAVDLTVDIEQNTSAPELRPRKVAEDGHVFILMPDGSKYDVTGRQIADL